MVPVGYNKIVLTEWMDEMWEDDDIAKERSEQKKCIQTIMQLSNPQTDFGKL